MNECQGKVLIATTGAGRRDTIVGCFHTCIIHTIKLFERFAAAADKQGNEAFVSGVRLGLCLYGAITS